MMYSKEELNELVKATVEKCKEELAKGNKTLDFNLTIEGKETRVYMDCQGYLNDVKLVYGIE